MMESRRGGPASMIVEDVYEEVGWAVVNVLLEASGVGQVFQFETLVSAWGSGGRGG